MRNTERRNKRNDSSDSEGEFSEIVAARRRHVHQWRHRNHSGNNKDSASSGWISLALLAALGWTSIGPPVSSPELFDMNFDSNHFPAAYKPRPTRLRYRDEISLMRHSWNTFNNDMPMMMMPLVTERPRPSVHNRPPMMTPSSSNQQDPSLEDIELIDVLWRSDIAAEKGAREVAPSDQYERDLQLLTEKSVREPLTSSETARYENLAKGYFEDFYRTTGFRSGKDDGGMAADLRREVSTPTDEDLDALLEDVTKEGGQLDQLCPDSLLDTNRSPLMNNVSLGQGIIFNANNVTELSTYVQCTERPQAILSDNDLFSNSTLDSPNWPQPSLAPSDIFPTGQDHPVFPVFPSNETATPIVSTGVHFNHSYQSTAPRPEMLSPQSELYDSYYVPNAYSNESSSICSSTSRSPNYLSETENLPPASRYFGKLAPAPNDFHSKQTSDDSGIESNSGASSPPPGPRRRGRQSKDEQLAKLHNLPLSAKDIAEMGLSELQKLLKSDSITENQKALIKKIRRRGKNKVAARTCRQRRGDRMTKATHDHWASVNPEDIDLKHE